MSKQFKVYEHKITSKTMKKMTLSSNGINDFLLIRNGIMFKYDAGVSKNAEIA